MTIFETATIVISVLIFVLGGFATFMFYSFRKNVDDVEKLRDSHFSLKDDLANFRTQVAQNHPTNVQFEGLSKRISDGFEKMSRDLQGMMNDIRDKLDRKEDKK